MNCSIKDNILYGKQEARNSEVFRAAELSNALEFILQNSHQVSLQQQQIENLKREFNIIVLNDQKIDHYEKSQIKKYLEKQIESLEAPRRVQMIERDKRDIDLKDIYLPKAFE